tara:strand:- start:363 stop:758 length:396 start_codon:yes stop_codon:yes gene_type:complete
MEKQYQIKSGKDSIPRSMYDLLWNGGPSVFFLKGDRVNPVAVKSNRVAIFDKYRGFEVDLETEIIFSTEQRPKRNETVGVKRYLVVTDLDKDGLVDATIEEFKRQDIHLENDPILMEEFYSAGISGLEKEY